MNSINTFWWGARSVSLNFRCLYLRLRKPNAIAKKNKDTLRERDNHKKQKRISIKLYDPAKNTENL